MVRAAAVAPRSVVIVLIRQTKASFAENSCQALSPVRNTPTSSVYSTVRRLRYECTPGYRLLELDCMQSCAKSNENQIQLLVLFSKMEVVCLKSGKFEISPRFRGTKKDGTIKCITPNDNDA